ncbi:F-box domain-containing protein [Mycena sanguinolenta]|uniref:F-box domain-containing protein n=1 Tax=Mycena sanguinolenta TaxID=230812 RepID=A0A8H6YNP2_9AGAR|nr:F-box domain-containing protein [Mycena sanguinolenta]
MSAGHPSLILEFPPELMLEIFKLSMPSVPGRPSPLEAPLLLAQICRQWREICLDSPELWSSVEFYRPSSIPNLASDLVDLWLSRAKSHPLQLSLEDKFMGHDPVPALLAITMRWASQWEVAHIKFPIAASKYLRTTSFPLLRRLAVVINVSHLEGETITISNAPLLRSVEVTERNWYNIRWSRISLPWAQLTELLFYTFADVSDAVFALKECPSLTRLYCRIAYVPGSLPHYEMAGSLSLNHLRALSTPIQLLPHLALPKLESLHITDPAEARPLVAYVVEGLLARSFCILKSLQYDMYHHEGKMGDDLHDLLRVVPTILRLRINFSRGLAVSRIAEAISSDSPPLVPDLRYLYSSLDRGYAWNPAWGPYHDALCNALRWRSAQNALRSFDFQVNALPSQALSALRLVAAETGLSIRVFAHK